MEDWHDCNDPAELRIRLDVALEENAELRAELAGLKAENQRLRTQLGMPAADNPRALPLVPDPPAPAVVGEESGLPYADATSGTEVKTALFRALFAGREDVYATRWVSAKSGRTGWSPAEDNPFAKNKNDAERVFWPLTDRAVYNHLSRPEPGSREVHLGLYPLLADDTCRLLAVDFDGKDGSDWRGDAAAYAAACHDAGVPALVEISRSGAGAHAPRTRPDGLTRERSGS
ncbi:hypothetical protein ACFYP6_22420 [Streptomyces goshikiensis]|uniref:TOTE conflict system archaeo-eukaryotic primase domain-containing protein n=1 Tax=Streptomyces goshikiensis TaxID=1942 RepID=UPI0036A2BFE3